MLLRRNICWLCGDTPCEWIRWGDEIKEQEVVYKTTHLDDISNAKIRKMPVQVIIVEQLIDDYIVIYYSSI